MKVFTLNNDNNENSNLDYSSVTNVKINAGTTNIMSYGIDAGTYLIPVSAQLLQNGSIVMAQ